MVKSETTKTYDEGYAAGRVFAGLDADQLAKALEALRSHAVWLGPNTSDFDDPEEAKEDQALHNRLIEMARVALDKHKKQTND